MELFIGLCIVFILIVDLILYNKRSNSFWEKYIN